LEITLIVIKSICLFVSALYHLLIHGKNSFAKVSKNLARYRPENNFVRNQNNYVERSRWLLEYQNFLQ